MEQSSEKWGKVLACESRESKDTRLKNIDGYFCCKASCKGDKFRHIAKDVDSSFVSLIRKEMKASKNGNFLALGKRNSRKRTLASCSLESTREYSSLEDNNTKKCIRDYSSACKMKSCEPLPITPPHSPELEAPLFKNYFPQKTAIFHPPVNFGEMWRRREREETQSTCFSNLAKQNYPELTKRRDKQIDYSTISISQLKDVEEIVTSDCDVDSRDEKNIPENVACKIFGLLSLQSPRERRYEVTAEELHRRANAPEHLNKVDLISYVRLSKNSARDLLQKHDVIKILNNRRSKRTILSKVSEEECRDLADGIKDIYMSYFPSEHIAKKRVEKLNKNTCDERLRNDILEGKLKQIETVRAGLKSLLDTVTESKNDKEIETFELISHKFGLQNILNHIKFLDNYFQIEKEVTIASITQG